MESITLRIAGEDDLDWLLELENDSAHWAASDRTHSYSRYELAQFLIENRSFYPKGNLRFIICSAEEEESVGVLDIFAYDVELKTASLGILIFESKNRRLGFGVQALAELEEIAFKDWDLASLQALVQQDNIASQGLFTKAGYAFKRKQDKGMLLFQKDRL